MARRKSAAAQLYTAYKKRKRAKEQAEQRAQREYDQWGRQQLREAEPKRPNSGAKPSKQNGTPSARSRRGNEPVSERRRGAPG